MSSIFGNQAQIQCSPETNCQSCVPLPFKNIQSRSQLGVFAPENVYAVAGSREGMVPLFEGEVDYRTFIKEASHIMPIEASLEWFGSQVKNTLAKDFKEVMGTVLTPHLL